MKMFVPTADWRDVPDDEILPPGCEIQMSMASQNVQARLRPVKPWPSTRDVCKAASRRTIATVSVLAGIVVIVLLGAVAWVLS